MRVWLQAVGRRYLACADDVRRAAECRRAATTVELYERQLERLEADYGKAVVRQLFSLLWASRRGLHADAELRVAMAQASFEVDAYAELMLVIEEKLLICRGGDPLGCARA